MKHLVRQLLLLAALALACAVAACVPKERFAWSPDGEEATVILDGRLQIVDGEGRKVQEFSDRDGSPGTLRVESAAWTPDGNSLLVKRVRILSKWEEVLDTLGVMEPENVKESSFLDGPYINKPPENGGPHPIRAPDEAVWEVRDLSRAIPSMLEAAMALSPSPESNPDTPEAMVIPFDPDRAHLLRAAFRLAWEEDPDRIREILNRHPWGVPAGTNSALENWESREQEQNVFVLHEIVLLDPAESGGEGEILAQGFQALSSPVLSPDGKLVVFSERAGDAKTVDLILRAVDRSDRRWSERIAEDVHETFVWTEDGRALLVVAPLLSEDALLKQIRRIEVRNEYGGLMLRGGLAVYKKERWSTETLATALIPFTPRLAVLPGGDILFAAQSGELPLVGDSPEFDTRFHRLDPETGSLAAVPTAEGALPMDLGFFALAPDGERIAVVEAASDAVAVVEVESGRSEIVSPAHPEWKCRTLPAWRNDTELTYAALAEEESAAGEGSAEPRVRWMAWDADSGERRELSRDWVPLATADWLERKKAKHGEGGRKKAQKSQRNSNTNANEG